MSKTVGLIIPNGGGTPTLKRLMRGLNKIKTPIISHLIVVCQSKDGAEIWLRKQEEEQDNLYVIYNIENSPPPVPYNDGLDLLRSFKEPPDYIHFLDDDMEVLDPTYLRQMIDFYEDNEEVALMSSEHCYFSRPFPKNGRVPDFGMGAFLFSRDHFNELGFLDERFKFHCADSDYCKRTLELTKKEISLLPGSYSMLRHYHQLGTRKKFEGSHQPIIDNDWVIYGDKWDHGGVELEFQERLNKEDRRKYWSDKSKKATGNK